MKPKVVAINNDDYHAKYVGIKENGDQFILTTPFVPAVDGPGCEFIALYLFDKNGKLKSHKIQNFGPREMVDKIAVEKAHVELIEWLGIVKYSRVNVAPFSVRDYGVEFGLIYRDAEDEDDVEAVEMQPGNYMAFFEPWDSGDYDT